LSTDFFKGKNSICQRVFNQPHNLHIQNFLMVQSIQASKQDTMSLQMAAPLPVSLLIVLAATAAFAGSAATIFS
jgi:hypothetical protein